MAKEGDKRKDRRMMISPRTRQAAPIPRRSRADRYRPTFAANAVTKRKLGVRFCRYNLSKKRQLTWL
jgi:hypothetical protein